MSAGTGRRRRGRELALKVLFEIDGTERDPLDTLIYRADDGGDATDVVAYARRLVTGAIGHSDAIDAAIVDASTNWPLSEIGKVERAILRLGAYEVLFETDMPAAVAIDEAIELTRVYAGDEAGGFVNGVLGKLLARDGEAAVVIPERSA